MSIKQLSLPKHFGRKMFQTLVDTNRENITANCKDNFGQISMKTKYILLLIFVPLIIIVGIFNKDIRFFVSPHYLDNDAVYVGEKLYSPDSSVAVVYYTLDVGARGDREYKCILKENDYDNELMTNNLPPEIVVVKWVDNQTLKVIYDPNEAYRLGGTYTELDMTKDIITVNGINLIVTERKPKEKHIP